MNERITEEAWRWHQALERDDADWDGFTLWLEADPQHRAAYDAVATIDDALTRQKDRLDLILPPDPASAPVASGLPAAVAEAAAPRPRRRGLWLGGAVAAVLALVVAVPVLRPGAAPESDYRTGSGETRAVDLADGSRITLGPSSRLTLSGSGPLTVRLEGGAWFDIRHDPARTLTVVAGDQRITDIGTKFDILSLAGHVYVAVAEGQVAVGPQAEGAAAVTVTAGRSLTVDSRTHEARLRPVAAGDVGGWRAGRLVYDDAPLALVAADLSRYARQAVSVAPEVAQRRFSGVLAVGKNANPAVELGNLMGLQAQADGSGLRLGAGGR